MRTIKPSHRVLLICTCIQHEGLIINCIIQTIIPKLSLGVLWGWTLELSF